MSKMAGDVSSINENSIGERDVRFLAKKSDNSN